MHYLRKELYELVKADDRIFDFLQYTSLDGMWFRDLENLEEEWMNEAFWATLGYNPAEMPNRSSAWESIVHPEDLKSIRENIARLMADPSVPYDQVVRFTHLNGSIVYLHCRGMVIHDEQKRPKRLLGTNVDITQVKQKEILLDEVNKIVRIGSWEVDLIKSKVWWSEMTKEIHGVADDFVPDLEAGINFYKEGESRDTIQNLVLEAINHGTPFDKELILVNTAGKDVWVRSIGRVDRIEGKTRRLFGIFQDIDERKRNEGELMNMGILESKSREMEQFAYAASHDLREPLLTIKGYIEVLEEDHLKELSATALNHLQIIRGATERMDKLIHGMLDYSRLSQLKQLQEVDLNNLADELRIDLEASINDSGAQLVYDQLPTVMGYPIELKIMLQNLLSNAFKFVRPDRKPVVHIEAVLLENGYRISVADNGIGIDVKDRSRIFDLFRRLHAKDKYDGLGIGLANVKKVVELHNGSIEITNNEADGTTIIATLQP